MTHEPGLRPPEDGTFYSKLEPGSFRGLLVLGFACLGINLLFLVRFLTGDGLAGCGAESACDEVLTSRWSAVFGIPLSVFGALTYAGLLGVVISGRQRFLAALLGMIAGAAVWLTFVQAFLIGSFCPWCMTAHLLGLLIVGLGLLRLRGTAGARSAMARVAGFGVIALVGIGGGQWLGPRPVTHRIDAVAAHSVAEPVHARRAGRKVSFADGSRIYNVDALPHVGSGEAKHVMVEYFDYQCASCRTMHGHLAAFLEQHPGLVCVIVLPVPLEGACNPHLGATRPHPGSCDITRLALALWKLDRQAFTRFHEAALGGASLEALSRLARKAVGTDKLDEALGDPWIDELIAANAADWVAFSKSSAHLPKLLIGGKRILHGLPSGSADFIRVMEQELKL